MRNTVYGTLNLSHSFGKFGPKHKQNYLTVIRQSSLLLTDLNNGLKIVGVAKSGV